jgi:hypothetical protein
MKKKIYLLRKLLKLKRNLRRRSQRRRRIKVHLHPLLHLIVQSQKKKIIKSQKRNPK